MSQSESSNPLVSSQDNLSAEMATKARAATARIIQLALEATADAAQFEREVRTGNAKFPSMQSLPPALSIDPQRIVDFTRSEEYSRLVENYVQGRIEGHLLTRVLELLGRLLPAMFAT